MSGIVNKTGNLQIENQKLRRLRSRVYHLDDSGSVREADKNDSLYLQEVNGTQELFFSGNQITEGKVFKAGEWDLKDGTTDTLVTKDTAKNIDLQNKNIDAVENISTDSVTIVNDEPITTESKIYKNGDYLYYGNERLNDNTHGLWEYDNLSETRLRPKLSPSTNDYPNVEFKDKSIQGVLQAELKYQNTPINSTNSGYALLYNIQPSGIYSKPYLYLDNKPVSPFRYYLEPSDQSDTYVSQYGINMSQNFLENVENFSTTANSENLLNGTSTTVNSPLTVSNTATLSGQTNINGTFSGGSSFNQYVDDRSRDVLNTAVSIGNFFTSTIENVSWPYNPNILPYNVIRPRSRLTQAGNQAPGILVSDNMVVESDLTCDNLYVNNVVKPPEGGGFWDFIGGAGGSIFKIGAQQLGALALAGGLVFAGAQVAIGAIDLGDDEESLVVFNNSGSNKYATEQNVSEFYGNPSGALGDFWYGVGYGTGNLFVNEPVASSKDDLEIAWSYGLDNLSNRLTINNIPVQTEFTSAETVSYSRQDFYNQSGDDVITKCYPSALSYTHEYFYSIGLKEYSDFSTARSYRAGSNHRNLQPVPPQHRLYAQNGVLHYNNEAYRTTNNKTFDNLTIEGTNPRLNFNNTNSSYTDTYITQDNTGRVNFYANGQPVFNFISNAVNFNASAGAYFTGNLVFSGDNNDVVISKTGTSSKSLRLQAGDDNSATTDDFAIELIVRDSSATTYTAMKVNGKSQQIEINRDMTLDDARGIIFEGITEPAVTTNKLYRGVDGLYFNGNRIGSGNEDTFFSLTNGVATTQPNINQFDFNTNLNVSRDDANANPLAKFTKPGNASDSSIQIENGYTSSNLKIGTQYYDGSWRNLILSDGGTEGQPSGNPRLTLIDSRYGTPTTGIKGLEITDRLTLLNQTPIEFQNVYGVENTIGSFLLTRGTDNTNGEHLYWNGSRIMTGGGNVLEKDFTGNQTIELNGFTFNIQNGTTQLLTIEPNKTTIETDLYFRDENNGIQFKDGASTKLLTYNTTSNELELDGASITDKYFNLNGQTAESKFTNMLIQPQAGSNSSFIRIKNEQEAPVQSHNLYISQYKPDLFNTYFASFATTSNNMIFSLGSFDEAGTNSAQNVTISRIDTANDVKLTLNSPWASGTENIIELGGNINRYVKGTFDEGVVIGTNKTFRIENVLNQNRYYDFKMDGNNAELDVQLFDQFQLRTFTNNLYEFRSRLIPGQSFGADIFINPGSLGRNLHMGLFENTAYEAFIYTTQFRVALATNGGTRFLFQNADFICPGVVSATGYLTTSDERIKKNIRNLKDDECLNIVKSIEPKKYGYIDHHYNDEEVVGFIAQDLEPHIPSAVTTEKGYLPYVWGNVEVSNNILKVLECDTSKLKVGDKIEVTGVKEGANEAEVLEIISKTEFKVNIDYEEEKARLLGVIVDDKKQVKLNRLVPVLWSATQELINKSEETQNCKVEIATLTYENQQLKERLNKIESILLKYNMK